MKKSLQCPKCGGRKIWHLALYAKGIESLEKIPGVCTLLDNEPKATLR